MADHPQRAERPRLYINHMAEYDWLIALEFGRVDEGQPEDAWTAIGENFGYLFDRGRCVGFKLIGVADFDLDAPEHEVLWQGPRFDAPTLALTDCSAGEVILAARNHFGERSSFNRYPFQDAVESDDLADELNDWVACLESGDSMAHFGLGVALYDAGHTKRAYTHLRYYASIASQEPWAQYWYARAARRVGEQAEARTAARRVLTLDADEHARKAAEDLLERLTQQT